MKFLIVLLLTVTGCAVNPFVVERVNAHLYRSPQPATAAQWAEVDAALGRGGVVVKLNDEAEGSESGAGGLFVARLAIEPKGDGPIYAQLDGVLTKPDPIISTEAVLIACDPALVVLVHCSHGWDRTGYVVARERVQCEGWAPAAAHEEWHRKAHYVPYGDRVPAPGLEEAWEDFVEQWSAPARAAASVGAAQSVFDALAGPGTRADAPQH